MLVETALTISMRGGRLAWPIVIACCEFTWFLRKRASTLHDLTTFANIILRVFFRGGKVLTCKCTYANTFVETVL